MEKDNHDDDSGHEGGQQDKDKGGNESVPTCPPEHDIAVPTDNPVPADRLVPDEKNPTAAVPPPPPAAVVAADLAFDEEMRRRGFVVQHAWPPKHYPPAGAPMAHPVMLTQNLNAPVVSHFPPTNNYLQFGGNSLHYVPSLLENPPTRPPDANLAAPTTNHNDRAREQQPPPTTTTHNILAGLGIPTRGITGPNPTITVIPQVPLSMITQLQQQLAAASSTHNVDGASIVMFPVPVPHPVTVPVPTAATTRRDAVPRGPPSPTTTTTTAAGSLGRASQDNKTSDLLSNSSHMFGIPRPERRKRKYTHESFPEKLHRLIREAKQNGKDNIVRFSDDGSKFQILSTAGFEGQILSNYFRHNKITSFKRLLHLYGFRRIQGTWNAGTFEHEKFHRDYPDLCRTIERVERGFGLHL
mmetsp:Transcript_14480/g.27569  ORF Transcript_14480/g.27569 Transcript_14480/m.27569 type:complete len:412 (-) Transcript_14480:26-1261(-)